VILGVCDGWEDKGLVDLDDHAFPRGEHVELAGAWVVSDGTRIRKGPFAPRAELDRLAAAPHQRAQLAGLVGVVGDLVLTNAISANFALLPKARSGEATLGAAAIRLS
jgi:hypothetical protein